MDKTMDNLKSTVRIGAPRACFKKGTVDIGLDFFQK